MARIVFDIETIGEDFNSMDETTKDVLTKWIKKESETEKDYEIALENLKNGLGFSPMTGEIAAIGVLDIDTNQGAVYYQAPNETIPETEENGIKLKQMTEEEMLKQFWEIARYSDEFISFNGRCFDAPFMIIRSAIKGIRPTKNLMEGRYAYQQRNCRHVDLMDELTFQGAFKRSSLHLACHAFGIKSPKEDGVNGDDVSRLFKEKRYLDIARYNVGDLYATRDLYGYWEKFIRI